MNSKKIGFGIIGAGMIAKFHATAMANLSNAFLVGIYDKNYESARRLAAEFQCRAYESLEDFLSDHAVEAVTIATPSGMHGSVAIAAANAGKHILCEKPLEITLEKVDAVIAETYRMEGIYYIRVWLNEGELNVGDDIMYVLIGGDIRPRVVDALQYLVGRIKNECVSEIERN